MMMSAHALDPASLARMRWRCRRGLLELDIVLERFTGHYADLDVRQQEVFDMLLDKSDTELWDFISGKVPVLDDEYRALIALINKA